MLITGIRGFDSSQAAMAFLEPQLAHVEAQVYRTRYPTIRYRGLIPVDTSANPWAQSVLYYSTDTVGQAQWANSRAGDVPNVETTRSQGITAVHMGTIGYEWTDEELAQAQLLGIPLAADKAIGARRAAEMFIDHVFCEGDAEVGLSGFFNSPYVSVAPVAAPGGVSVWAQKTPAQILADINAVLTGIYVGSSEVELADTLAMPPIDYAYIATTPFNQYSEKTILEYVMKANVYTTETGQPLKIRGVRGLEAAGAGGVGRMIAYRNSKDVLKAHMPMPFQFGHPREKAAWTYEVPGRFRVGGVDVRLPGAMRYMDGLS